MAQPMNADRSPSAGSQVQIRLGACSTGSGVWSAWIFVAMAVAAIALAIAAPPPPTAGGTATLSYIAAHRTLYIVYQQLWAGARCLAIGHLPGPVSGPEEPGQESRGAGCGGRGQRLGALPGHPDHEHRSSRAGLSE